MSTYVLVGNAIRFPASPIDTVRGFGSRFELDDSVAEGLKQRASILPLADFEALGFTEQELPRYAAPDSWASAPEPFRTKQKAAWAALETYRSRGQSQAPIEKGE